MKKKENSKYEFESCIEIGNEDIEERTNIMLQKFKLHGRAMYGTNLQFQNTTQFVMVELFSNNTGIINYENENFETIYLGEVDIEKNQYYLYKKPIVHSEKIDAKIFTEEIYKAHMHLEFNKKLICK